MARTPVEIGQAFHKAESPLVVWTVASFNEFTEPMHARVSPCHWLVVWGVVMVL